MEETYLVTPLILAHTSWLEVLLCWGWSLTAKIETHGHCLYRLVDLLVAFPGELTTCVWLVSVADITIPNDPESAPLRIRYQNVR
jgi:hypothetical protein